MDEQNLREFFPDDDQMNADLDDPEHRRAVGRLVEPESGVDQLDTIAEPIATDVGADDDDLSAEEAGMHIVEDDRLY